MSCKLHIEALLIYFPYHRCHSLSGRRYYRDRVEKLRQNDRTRYIQFAQLLARCELYRVSYGLQQEPAREQEWFELLEEATMINDIQKVLSQVLGCNITATRRDAARKVIERAESMDKIAWRAQVTFEH